MRNVLLAFLVMAFQQAPIVLAPQGDADNGAKLYVQKQCHSCHGPKGEGGFGPDLAGPRITWSQFRHTIRKPWGVMLTYTEQQLPDAALADIYAWVSTQPRVGEPGEWHWSPAPPTAPLGQRYYMNTAGCGQCHEPENKYARMWLGETAKDVNFEYFAKQIYTHTDKYRRGNMGNFSRDRLPEPILREIYTWMEGLGWRASIAAALSVRETKTDATTYALNVTNRGQKNKGVRAERLTLFVHIPPANKVVSASGPGYVGVMPALTLGLQPALSTAPHADLNGHVERPKDSELTGDVAVWRVPSLASQEKLEMMLTLSGPANPEEVRKGFQGSTVYWEKPGRRPSGSPPVMVYRDLRMPDTGDAELIYPPGLQMFTPTR